VWVLGHLPRIADPPLGYHQWRESDTMTVAANYAFENMDFFRPRVDVRGNGDGVVGMEFPLYSWVSAWTLRAFGHSHVWPRLLTVTGGVVLLFAIRRLAREVTGDRRVSDLAMLAALASPLLWFYGRKIQPDVWACALAVLGAAGFIGWTREGGFARGAASAVAFAAGAAMRPTLLGLGLPLLWLRISDRGPGARAITLPQLLWGLVVVAFALGWLAYARALAAANPGYFFLGDGLRDLILEGIRDPMFWRNVLLTWPVEMIVGLTLLLPFAIGAARLRGQRGAGFVVAWLAGGFTVCVLAAKACALAHDYYVLPWVPALAIVTAAGTAWMLAHRRRVVRLAALALLVAAPAGAVIRVQKRYGAPYDFRSDRAMAARSLAPDARVVAYGRIPGILLYRTGRKGWHVSPDWDPRGMGAAVADGARYLLVDVQRDPDPSAFAPYVVAPPLYTHQGIAAYATRAPDQTSAPAGP
jgi:4-amino-4-deoxy-L-arabinose transferase-like glycosyltransferase